MAWLHRVVILGGVEYGQERLVVGGIAVRLGEGLAREAAPEHVARGRRALRLVPDASHLVLPTGVLNAVARRSAAR
eukprot:11849254-Alexandrium_andersonii.AAC.1